MKRTILRSEQGVTIVEFSVTLLIFLVMAFGIVEFGSMIQERNVITHMAREAASLASRDLSQTNEILNLMVASSAPLDFTDTDRFMIFLATANAETSVNPNITCNVQAQGTLSHPDVHSPDVDPNCDLTTDLANYLQFNDPPGTAQVQTFTIVKVYYQHSALTPMASLLNMPFFGGGGGSNTNTLLSTTAIF